MTVILSNYFRSDLFCGKSFDHVSDFNIAVVSNRNTALHAVSDFAGVVFKAAQRTDLAFKDHNIIAQQSHFRIALDGAVKHSATGNGPNLRDTEGLANFGTPLIRF